VTNRDDLRGSIRGEVGRRDPVLVAALATEGEELTADDVPDTDSPVTASRRNQVVVGRDVAGQHVAGVANETSRGAVGQRPKAHRLVPGSRENVLSIGGDSNVLNNVAVAEQRALGEAGGLTIESQLPDNDRLVTGARHKSVRALAGGGERGHPTVVALKGAAELQSFDRSHFFPKLVLVRCGDIRRNNLVY